METTAVLGGTVATDETVNMISADKVVGTSVYNRQGEKLGSVYTLMLNKLNGQVAYAVMSFGGFLGIGESYHPLPWRILSYDTALGGYVVDLDRRRLEGAPTYTPGRGARLAYLSRAHRRLLRHPACLTDGGPSRQRRRFRRHGAAPRCRQLAFFDWPDSDMAMATACFRLRTFLPEPPFSVPFLCSCITLWTFFFCVAVAIYFLRKTA
jgi:hypothetical protein